MTAFLAVTFAADLSSALAYVGFGVTAVGLPVSLYLARSPRGPTRREQRVLTVAGLVVLVLLVVLALRSRRPSDHTSDEMPPTPGPVSSASATRSPSASTPAAGSAAYCERLRDYEDTAIGAEAAAGTGRLRATDVQPVLAALDAAQAAAPASLLADGRTLSAAWTELRDRLTDSHVRNTVVVLSTISGPAATAASRRIGEYEQQNCPR